MLKALQVYAIGIYYAPEGTVIYLYFQVQINGIFMFDWYGSSKPKQTHIAVMFCCFVNWNLSIDNT